MEWPPSQTLTSDRVSGNGSGCSSTALTTEKIALFAPIPRASVPTATMVKRESDEGSAARTAGHPRDRARDRLRERHALLHGTAARHRRSAGRGDAPRQAAALTVQNLPLPSRGGTTSRRPCPGRRSGRAGARRGAAGIALASYARALEHEVDSTTVGAPGRRLTHHRPLSRRSQLIELRLPALIGYAPRGAYEAALLEPVQCRVEGSLAHS